MLKLAIVAAVMVASASATSVHTRLKMRSRTSKYARGKNMVGLRGTAHAAGRSETPEKLEDWEDSGNAVHSKLSDDQLFELASPVTPDFYGKELHSFVDTQTSRFVAHQGNFDTADYLKKQFTDMGLNVSMQVVKDNRIKEQLLETDPSALKSRRHTNVIGFLKGGDLAHEVVLLGAHYDSVNWEDTTGPAPGVDDNGSGSALMLALARSLTSKKFQPRRSVMFVAFNAEEEGLVGSDHFAETFTKGGPGKEKYGDLKAALIADEVAWPGTGKLQRQAIFETSGQEVGTAAMVDTLAKLALLSNKTSSVRGDGLGDGQHNFVVNYHGFGSDHMSFLDRGIPAVLLIERDDDYHARKWGHSARDTFDHIDISYGASMTRLALRAIASFANPAFYSPSGK